MSQLDENRENAAIKNKESSNMAGVFDSVRSFCAETAEWRRPVASAVYLLATNAIFWACVFYGEHFYQFSFLVGLSVLIFIHQLVFPLAFNGISFVKNTSAECSNRFSSFSESTGREQVVSCIKFIFTLPYYAIVLPLFYCLRWILVEKFVEYVIMTTSAAAAGLLKTNEIEKACWVSYLSVLFVLSVPPWRCNEVTKQLTDSASSSLNIVFVYCDENCFRPFVASSTKVLVFLQYYFLGYWIPPLVAAIKVQLTRTKDFFVRTVFEPTWRFLVSVKNAFVYVFFGYWIPPLVEFIKTKILACWGYIWITILAPIGRFLAKVRDCFVYVFFGYWIPPLVDYIRMKLNEAKEWCDVKIVQPIGRKVVATKNFLVYWFCGHWIPPLLEWWADFKRRAKETFHRRVIDPIVDFFMNFTENMTYILMGRWIPGLLRYFHEKWLVPACDFCIRCKNALVFIFCGYWIPDFLAFLRRKRDETADWIRLRYVEPTKAWILETVRRIREYLIETKRKIKEYVLLKLNEFREWLCSVKIRTKLWIVDSRRRLKHYCYNDLWVPFKKTCRRAWIRFKFFVKYRIFYPFIRNSILSTIYLIQWTYSNVGKPAFNAAYELAVHFCGYVWFYYGDPSWHWISERLPEKSPFVDDSDTELADYLPPERNRTEHSSESEEETETIQRRDSGEMSRSPSSSSLEEAEFSKHLEIPSLEQADSDSEQERAMIPVAKKPKSVKKTVKRSAVRKLDILSDTKSSSSKAIPLQKSPSSPMQEFTTAISSAASLAMLKASMGASIFSSRVGNVFGSPTDDSSKDNEEAAFERELEPDFELVQHSDIDD